MKASAAVTRKLRLSEAVALLAGAIAVVVLCYFLLKEAALPFARPTAGPDLAQESAAPGAEAGDPATRPRVRGTGATLRVEPHPFPDVPRTRDGLPLEGDPFLATSVEEQEWLDRNGYPTLPLWLALGKASDAELEQAARAGDVSAQALSSQRRLLAGDTTAMDAMLKAGASGNTFALELLSASLAGPMADPVAGYALSRVVELRGNTRIGFNREVMFNTPLTPMQRFEAEQEAATLYQKIVAIQRSMPGPKRPAIDPRPIDVELPPGR